MSISGALPLSGQSGPLSVVRDFFGLPRKQDTANSDSTDPNTTRGQHQKGPLSLINGILSLPTCCAALFGQIEHIARLGSDDDGDTNNNKTPRGLMGFASQMAQMVAWLPEKFVEPDPSVNVNANKVGFFGVIRRFFHPELTKAITKLSFTKQNMLENITNPYSREDDRLFIGSLCSLLGPITIFSSVIGGLLMALPGHAASTLFAFLGKEKPLNAGKFFGDVGDSLMPLTANLTAFYRTVLSFTKSLDDGSNFVNNLKEYSIGKLDVIQGLLGAAFALPSSFGVLSRLRNIYNSLEEVEIRRHVASLVRNCLEPVYNTGQRLNLPIINQSFSEHQLKIENSIMKSFSFIGKLTEELTNSFINLPLIRNIFSPITIENSSGSLVTRIEHLNPDEDPETILNNNKNKDIFGIKVHRIGHEVSAIFHPIQSALMLLPYALVKPQDKYIQEHGNLLLRMADKALGITSSVLALPSYLTYFCTARAPQILLSILSFAQKQENRKGNMDYNAMNSAIRVVNFLENNPILSKMPINFAIQNIKDKIINNPYGNQIFTQAPELGMDQLVNDLEVSAREQEIAVKTPAVIRATRRLFRSLIDNKVTGKLFKISIEHGQLTPELQGKMAIYNTFNRFENVIKGGIPILGGLLAAPLGILKRPFKVKGAAAEAHQQEQVNTARTLKNLLGNMTNTTVNPASPVPFNNPNVMPAAA